MPKFILITLFFFISLFGFSQNSVTLKGKITNLNSKLPIESATVYLSKVKDSTLIEYTITDKNGSFDFKVKKTAEETFLKISNLGFDDYKKTIVSITSDIDFKNISIAENAKLLGEVVIKSEAPPIRIKKDTLEFNANSFKVRPDANVETLLKQLPGVEVGTDGKITVNGKEVNQILVNGKPFFDKDGKVALQSLPSEIINKVQISDTKTKKEELSGQVASSNNASINLTIDKDKNKGFFGKFMGGYGTEERYETSALINYFKDKRKLSVLASSNNINSTGFSMDEIFDNMGGGRNNFYYSDNGSFGVGGMRFGGGKGIIKSNMVGVNFADELLEDFEFNGSYLFTNGNVKNKNRTKQESLLPTGKFITESASNSNGDRFGHSLNFELVYKIDSTTTISYYPKFSKSRNKFQNETLESSKNESNQLLNESQSKGFNENDTNNFKSALYFNKAFRRKGRNLNVSFENENVKEMIQDFNKSTTVFYQSADPDDIRDQKRNDEDQKQMYQAEIEFSEPIKDSLTISIGAKYLAQSNTNDTDTYDYNGFTQSYIDSNDRLTNYLNSKKTMITPSSGVMFLHKKGTLNVNVGTNMIRYENYSMYLNNQTQIDKNYAYPFVNANLNLKFNKTKSVYMNYNYEIELPEASKILPVEDLANPLNTYIGNPNLSPNKYHSVYVNFRDFKTATKSGYGFYGGGSFYDSQVISTSSFDVNRKKTTTYQNVKGTYSSWFGTNWNKTIKKEVNTFKFSLGLNANFGLTKGVSNGDKFDAKSLRINPRASFTYEYGELLTVNPSYNFSYNDTKYTNYQVASVANVTHRFNLQTTNYWPKNWVFGNDFGYTYNSNIADGFKKDFYLWNTSLSYGFLGKKMTAKVKVYDLLNQNQSTTRSISATAIRDEENVVLKRYMMFSLTYKIEKFAGKEKPSRGNRIMF